MPGKVALCEFSVRPKGTPAEIFAEQVLRDIQRDLIPVKAAMDGHPKDFYCWLGWTFTRLFWNEPLRLPIHCIKYDVLRLALDQRAQHSLDHSHKLTGLVVEYWGRHGLVTMRDSDICLTDDAVQILLTLHRGAGKTKFALKYAACLSLARLGIHPHAL
jgi:hypothetical protein